MTLRHAACVKSPQESLGPSGGEVRTGRGEDETGRGEDGTGRGEDETGRDQEQEQQKVRPVKGIARDDYKRQQPRVDGQRTLGLPEGSSVNNLPAAQARAATGVQSRQRLALQY
jgi:hypothetical protein